MTGACWAVSFCLLLQSLRSDQVADQRATQKLLANALDVLKAVYDKKAFVQAKAKQARLRLTFRSCFSGTTAIILESLLLAEMHFDSERTAYLG